MADQIVNIHDAKTNLSRLVERVEQGEEIVIGRAGKPVARLVPVTEPAPDRVPGIWRGKVVYRGDFDELDDEITRLFEEGE